MAIEKNRFITNAPEYNSKRRYNVNNIVLFGGSKYQNITGGNGSPDLLIDWEKQPENSSGYSKILQWDGSSTISVPIGYSGTVFNQSTSQFCEYSVISSNLTISTNASEGDILQLTSN